MQARFYLINKLGIVVMKGSFSQHSDKIWYKCRDINSNIIDVIEFLNAMSDGSPQIMSERQW